MAAGKKKMDGSVEETTALSASEEDDDHRKGSIKWEGDPDVEGKTTINLDKSCKLRIIVLCFRFPFEGTTCCCSSSPVSL